MKITCVQLYLLPFLFLSTSFFLYICNYNVYRKGNFEIFLCVLTLQETSVEKFIIITHMRIHTKASGGDGITAKLFQILKDDAVKVLHSICQQIWKTQQWPQDWERSVFIPIPKKGNAKEYSNYCTIALILDASKVMLKILQARLQQYVNQELPDVQAGFRNDRGIRDQIANILCII